MCVCQMFDPLDGGRIEWFAAGREVERAVGFDAELAKFFPLRLDNAPAAHAVFGIEPQVQGRVPVLDRSFFRGSWSPDIHRLR